MNVLEKIKLIGSSKARPHNIARFACSVAQTVQARIESSDEKEARMAWLARCSAREAKRIAALATKNNNRDSLNFLTAKAAMAAAWAADAAVEVAKNDPVVLAKLEKLVCNFLEVGNERKKLDNVQQKSS